MSTSRQIKRLPIEIRIGLSRLRLFCNTLKIIKKQGDLKMEKKRIYVSDIHMNAGKGFQAEQSSRSHPYEWLGERDPGICHLPKIDK